MRHSRRTFAFGLAALGLTSACSTGGGTLGPAAAAGVPDDLRPVPNAGYDAWVAAFKNRASAQGISASTLDRGFRGTGYLPGVVKRDRNQTEFSRSLEDYLAIAASSLVPASAGGSTPGSAKHAVAYAAQTRAVATKPGAVEMAPDSSSLW